MISRKIIVIFLSLVPKAWNIQAIDANKNWSVRAPKVNEKFKPRRTKQAPNSTRRMSTNNWVNRNINIFDWLALRLRQELQTSRLHSTQCSPRNSLNTVHTFVGTVYSRTSSIQIVSSTRPHRPAFHNGIVVASVCCRRSVCVSQRMR